MKIQSKMIVSVGSTAVIVSLLVFCLCYWKMNSVLEENAERSGRLLKSALQEQARSDAEINAFSMEALFRSMFLHLKMLNMEIADICSRNANSGFPLLEAMERIRREKDGAAVRFLPSEAESLLIVAGGYQVREWRESCSETNHFRSDVAIPPELQNFRRNFAENTAMIVVPPDSAGYIWAAASGFSGGKYHLEAKKIKSERLLKNILDPDISSSLFLMHGQNMIGSCQQGEKPFADSAGFRQRMRQFVSRLVSVMGKRHFRTEILKGEDGRDWEFAAITLRVDSTPAQELRLVQANPSDPAASFLYMGAGRILFLILFVLFGLLFFFIALLLTARELSNSVNRILDFSIRLSRGEELPENLRAGKTEEIQVLSCTMNHLRDKFASMTVRLKKSHERELLARSDAESSSRMKSALLNDMVAELQEPVSMIAGFSGLLLHKLKHQEPGLLPLRKIHEEALTANRLLTALDNLSGLDLSGGESSYSEFNLSDVVRDISEICVPLALERHVAFETCCAGLPETVISDRPMMTRLLKLAATTLLSVAPPKSRVRWSCSDSRNEIRFRFYDTRMPDVPSLAVLFNERMQSPASKSAVSGFAAPILNLAVIRFQAAALGIGFQVQKTEESNTEIELVFPKQDSADLAFAGEAEEKQDVRHFKIMSSVTAVPDKNRKVYLSGERKYEILVADRSVSGFTMLSMMLENEPCVLTRTETPEECIRLLKERHFDFLLLDLNFQKMFCAPLLTAIRSDSRNPALIIIALSSGLTNAERMSVMDSGIDRILKKPVDMESLISAVHEYIRR